MNWKWLQIVALKQRGCFAPQGVSFLRREEGLKEAIKELSNGISNVSLPLKKWLKNICFAFFTPSLLICLLNSQCAPRLRNLTFLSQENFFLNHLTQPSDLMSGLLSTQPEIWFCVSQGHFLTTFVYLLVKLGLASNLFLAMWKYFQIFEDIRC